MTEETNDGASIAKGAAIGATIGLIIWSIFKYPLRWLGILGLILLLTVCSGIVNGTNKADAARKTADAEISLAGFNRDWEGAFPDTEGDIMVKIDNSRSSEDIPAFSAECGTHDFQDDVGVRAGRVEFRSYELIWYGDYESPALQDGDVPIGMLCTFLKVG